VLIVCEMSLRVTTTRGTLEAGEILIATSGYTSQLARSVQRRILPIGS
jgi:hypothetical protein